jgi:hypothetical protein
MNDRQKQTSLKYLLNEVTNSKKMQQKQFAKVMKGISLNENDISGMLQSGFFTQNEVTALSVLFKSTKTTYINENSIKRLDRSVKIIKEAKPGSKVLSEGFFGDIWDGLKGLGNKAKDAIEGGWSKMKAVWGEFKELTQEVVNEMSGMFVEAFEWGKGLATQEYNKVKQKALDTWNASMAKLDDVNKKKQLGTDIANVYETGQWTFNKFKSLATSVNAKWFKDTVEGKGNIDDKGLEMNPEKLEAGLEDLKNEAVLRRENTKIMNEKNELFRDSNTLQSLYEFYQKRLNEGGGTAHLEDAIENPLLKKVITVGVRLLQKALIPVAAYVAKLVEKKANEFLTNMSGVVNFFGGPGAFAFPVFSLIFAEIVEILIKNMTGALNPAKLVGKALSWLIPGLGPLVKGLEYLWTALKVMLLVYTIGNILFNLVLAVRKGYQDITAKKSGEKGGEEGGGEPEVQTAGYKPKGSFKLKEGKLVFIQ